MATDSPQTVPLKPAASLIVMRDRQGAPPDLLIIRRSAELRFAGGAYVFPGGRVDPKDALLAATHCAELDPEDGAARIAAMRETIEETSIVVGVRPDPDKIDTLSALLGGAYEFRLEALTSFARWQPGGKRSHRFDTRFYLAAAPAGAAPVADGTETADAFWASATEVLALCAAGNGFAIFPTRMILERLARFASFAEAREEALRLPQRIITPVMQDDMIRIPKDAGYPVTSERLGVSRRE